MWSASGLSMMFEPWGVSRKDEGTALVDVVDDVVGRATASDVGTPATSDCCCCRGTARTCRAACW